MCVFVSRNHHVNMKVIVVKRWSHSCIDPISTRKHSELSANYRFDFLLQSDQSVRGDLLETNTHTNILSEFSKHILVCLSKKRISFGGNARLGSLLTSSFTVQHASSTASQNAHQHESDCCQGGGVTLVSTQSQRESTVS